MVSNKDANGPLYISTFSFTANQYTLFVYYLKQVAPSLLKEWTISLSQLRISKGSWSNVANNTSKVKVSFIL